MSTKTMSRILILFVAAIVAAVCVLPFGTQGVAYADTYGGTEYSSLWYADSLHVAQAKQVVSTWNLQGISPIIIACVDTGINEKHELFSKTLTRKADGTLLGYNSYAAANEIEKDLGKLTDENSLHGTNVAGIMAMLILELGLEDYIKIYPIKANTPNSNEFSVDSVVEAINWASGDSIKADVVNLSLAIEASATKNKSWYLDDKGLLTAIENASKNSVLVAAAGNKSTDSDAALFYPAAHDGVLSVMNYGDNLSVYSTSNYGEAYDLIAPGQNIYTASTVVGAKNNYKEFTGTSASAAFVSVAAALLKLRYTVEGKLKIEDGVQKPSGLNFEIMLANLDSQKIAKGDYSFLTLDFAKVVTQDFSDTKYQYRSPTDISVEGDGTKGTGEYSAAYYQLANDIQPINFTATIKPLGKTNPALEEILEWYVKEVFDEVKDDTEDEEENPEAEEVEEVEEVEDYGEKVGRGLTYEFTAPHGGDYEVRAVIEYGGKKIVSLVKVHIEYLPYYAGDVRVTEKKHAGDDVDKAPSKATIYANKKLSLGLTGIEYVDQNVAITWYVNGEEVKINGEAYSGTTFDFVPKKPGTYVISAKYGDRSEISGDYVFVVVVKPAMANPIYITLVCVGGVLVLGAVALCLLKVLSKRIVVEDKAEKNTESGKEEKVE